MRWWPLTGTGVWSQASPHLPLGLESLPCQPCGGGGQELTVREHDRHALLPDLVEVRRNCELRSCRLCWWGPRAHREGPGDPRLVHIFVPAIGLWWQHRPALPPQCGLSRELGPLLVPCAARVESPRQPCTPKIATTRGTPAASSASASKAPSHTHSGPSPACSAAALKYPFAPGRWSCRFALGTCSVAPTARPYRFTRRPSGVVCGKTARPPRQSRAACGQQPGAAEPTPSCCASASGIPRWH